MPKTFEEISKSHPCFALGAKSNKGRIHLPVSPGCNIGCRFCKRDFNESENRPGVANGIISPDEALDAIRRAVELSPELTVVGVAGPGDTLATDFALETFRKVRDEFPQMIKCMSTNGLLLPQKADQIIDAQIDTLTVTVNAVDPEIQAKINEFIIYDGKRYEGIEAARILIDNQLSGIEKVAAAGVTVKVNTVFIPEVNKEHIPTVAQTVAKKGATVYNIIPLIPQHQFSWCSPPSCADLSWARSECEKYIKVFRHCQRCRADAVGVPGGQDFSKEVYIKPVRLGGTFSHG
ncbi:MAG: radical SAM protein [Treponema sp.]|nr:radical SAM protein [Treponema sp.]